MSGPSVNHWLTGRTKKIDPRYLADVAACTNASLDWLMTGKGKGGPGRKSGDPLSTVEKKLLEDFRKLSPKVPVEVSRLINAIA